MTPKRTGFSREGAVESTGTRAAASIAAASAVRRIRSCELLGTATELVIVHGQREYRLRVTSNGKLILTA